jgi:bifunctional non-homologous end joining protein LigD
MLFEGVVSKRREFTLRAGTTKRLVVKYKLNRSGEFIIGGVHARNPFTSLLVGYYQNGKLYYAGKVKNGFVPHTRREVTARFAGPKPLFARS